MSDTTVTRRDFALGDVLSITTGCLVSARHMEGVYDILNFMTGDNLYTHQLGRAADECKPWLLRWHPQLAEISEPDLDEKSAPIWLAAQIKLFGAALWVEQIPSDDHVHKNALTELAEMVPPEKIIVVESAS